MPVTQNLEKASSAIKAVAGIIALFPGIAVLLGVVDIPPSLADLVKVISFSVSGIVLLAVFLMSDRIARLSKERVALCSIAAVLLGAACTVGYFRFATSHTVVVDIGEGRSEKYIIPLSPTAEISEAVQDMGDYGTALQTAANRERLKQLMIEQSGSSMIIMIVLLVLSEILLVAPVVAAAWRLATRNPPKRRGPK